MVCNISSRRKRRGEGRPTISSRRKRGGEGKTNNNNTNRTFFTIKFSMIM
jgi:hypothetical protein